jgi:hypothetical protein
VYRLLLSVVTRDRVLPVVLFDRVARNLMGCPDDEARAPLRRAPGLREMCRMALRASRKC